MTRSGNLTFWNHARHHAGCASTIGRQGSISPCGNSLQASAHPAAARAVTAATAACGVTGRTARQLFILGGRPGQDQISESDAPKATDIPSPIQALPSVNWAGRHPATGLYEARIKAAHAPTGSGFQGSLSHIYVCAPPR